LESFPSRWASVDYHQTIVKVGFGLITVGVHVFIVDVGTVLFEASPPASKAHGNNEGNRKFRLWNLGRLKRFDEE
jgi:hypothetical protein